MAGAAGLGMRTPKVLPKEPDLIKAGFIKNDSEVKMPRDYPIKIWEDELKSRYLEE